MPTSPQVAAVVLAAGSGRRFGGTKQLAELDGRPLVEHAVATARRAGLAPVVVVVGHDAHRVRAVLPSDVEVVDNPAHATGQASSLRAGVAAVATSDAEGLVVLLADQPGIDPEVVVRVAAALGDGHLAARARYVDRPGHPVALARSTFGALATLTGDVGARDLLAELAVHEVPVAGPCPPDVDTPDDLPPR